MLVWHGRGGVGETLRAVSVGHCRGLGGTLRRRGVDHRGRCDVVVLPPDFPTSADEKDKLSAVAEQSRAQTDAMHTGLAAAGGAGAAFTLLLAVRQQRSGE